MLQSREIVKKFSVQIFSSDIEVVFLMRSLFVKVLFCFVLFWGGVCSHNSLYYRRQTPGAPSVRGFYVLCKGLIIDFDHSFDNDDMLTLGHWRNRVNNPGPVFTKRIDVVPPNFVKFRSRDIGSYNDHIVLNNDRHLGSAAAEVSAVLLPRCLSNFRAIGKV